MSVKGQMWVGSISYAQPGGKGDYPGAVCKKFWSVWGYNRFFTKNESMLVIDVTYVPVLLGLFTKVIVMYTNQLNEEEMADMNEVSREVEFKMAERRLERAKYKEEQSVKVSEAQTEVARLAEIGRKYEARVKHMKSLARGSKERKELTKKLNAGDPEILDGGSDA
jgi:hypothetical protein